MPIDTRDWYREKYARQTPPPRRRPPSRRNSGGGGGGAGLVLLLVVVCVAVLVVVFAKDNSSPSEEGASGSPSAADSGALPTETSSQQEDTHLLDLDCEMLLARAILSDSLTLEPPVDNLFCIAGVHAANRGYPDPVTSNTEHWRFETVWGTHKQTNCQS